jgi:hypothetical protein
MIAAVDGDQHLSTPGFDSNGVVDVLRASAAVTEPSAPDAQSPDAPGGEDPAPEV